MHPDPPQTDISRDPILDGRDSLRLVKLRLALALITVAIMPIAAISPLVRAAAEEARLAHHQRLESEAAQVMTSFQRELSGIESTATSLIADPDVLAAVPSGANGATRATASGQLGTLMRRDSGAVTGVTLRDAAGVKAAYGAPLDPTVLPAGDPVAGIVTTSDSGPEASSLVLVTVPNGGRGSLEIVTVMSMQALLSYSAPSRVPGQTIGLFDDQGATIATFHSAFDPSSLPGQVLDLATEAAHDSDGHSTFTLDGLAGWSAVVSAPIPLAALPIGAIGALALLIATLAGFTVWMTRQILRPAAQLEASRSRLRELYESAREAALRDHLTGLGNHRAFQEAVARMVEGSRRYGTVFSLVLLDIDEFKRINDTRGHAVGDQLLAQVGELIRVTIRHTDAGFRIGGDEFALLLPHTDAGGAVGLARRLLSRGLEDRGAGTYRGPISFSAGVTSCPEFGITRLELTAQADAALYRGKRAGRTVVTVYDPDKDHGHVDEGMRAELSSAISAVIEANWLSPVYQPIIDLATGAVSGYEGLVRVPRESTFAHTGALFDAAEVAGRVTDLDRAALEVVLRGAVNVSENLDLNLNVSPRTLESGEFNATVLLAILKRHDVRPERVVVELTEREAVQNPDKLRGVMQSFQKAGIRIAADDVGAGNAGLRLLSQFKFDIVKIDLSLVQGARQDQTLSVLTSLVQLANRWGAVTIAEGVETPTQLRTIRKLGITAGQGYLLGRPAAERDVSWVDLEGLEAREDDSPAAPLPDLATLAASAPRTLSSSPLLAGLSKSRAIALRKPTKTPQP